MTGDKDVAAAGAAVAEGEAAPRGAYLDYAAATPMDPEVVAAMLPYLTERFWNPSAPYELAREARDDVERARGTLARLIGARPGNVVLTAGATEANNLAFACVDGHVVTDAAEHESVLACAGTHSRRVVRVGPDGLVDPEAVRRAVRPQTELVSVELANGELGGIQPVRELSRVVARERARRLEAGERTPIWLHSDASQAAGCLSVNVSSLGVDLLTLSAAKVYGPKQVGLLWASDDVRLRPLVVGGGQERGVRSGTENVAGVVGFARAMELACERRAGDARRLARLRERLCGRLLERLPWACVAGPASPRRRLPGLLSVGLAGLEARRLVIGLEREGVSVGTGSACAASRMRVSHVLEAAGLPREVAEGSLRVTLGRPTTEAEVDYAADALERVARAEMARLGLADRDMGRIVAGALAASGWVPARGGGR